MLSQNTNIRHQIFVTTILGVGHIFSFHYILVETKHFCESKISINMDFNTSYLTKCLSKICAYLLSLKSITASCILFDNILNYQCFVNLPKYKPYTKTNSTSIIKYFLQ